VRKSFILQLGLIGRFAINVVDNLIIAHHQVSKVSALISNIDFFNTTVSVIIFLMFLSS